jgi:hypothetical protein
MNANMSSRVVLPVGLLVHLCGGIDRQAAAQPAPNSISNLRAIDVSPAELRLTVDYHYGGGVGASNVSIEATPTERNGIFDPRSVDFQRFPLRVGAHSATFVIKKRPPFASFTSESIRVCMLHSNRPFLCEDFPRRKTWHGVVSPPRPSPPRPPAPPPSSGTCLVSGRISGTTVWVIRDSHGRRHQFRVSHVVLHTPGSQPIRVPVQVHGNGRGYVARRLPAGRTYSLRPGNFQAEPRERTIVCSPGSRHTGMNFRITGPPPID